MVAGPILANPVPAPADLPQIITNEITPLNNQMYLGQFDELDLAEWLLHQDIDPNDPNDPNIVTIDSRGLARDAAELPHVLTADFQYGPHSRSQCPQG